MAGNYYETHDIAYVVGEGGFPCMGFYNEIVNPVTMDAPVSLILEHP